MTLEAIGERMSVKKVEYVLVHNIIHAGIEFAEEFGFSPDKDFTSITQFMLEEDTDDIELMEIDCGMDGIPAYVRGPYDTEAKIKLIISKLEQTAGKGNYTIIDEDGDFEDIDEEDDDDYLDDDEFAGMTIDEKKKLFLSLYATLSKQTKEEAYHFFALTNSLVFDLTDEEQYDQYCDDLFEELYVDITEGEIPDELLGIEPGSRTVSDELKSKFVDIYNLISDDLKIAKNEFKKFKEEVPEFPGISFIELQILQEEKPSKYSSRLKELVQKYPNYQLLNVLWTTEQLSNDNSTNLSSSGTLKMSDLYPGRSSIHTIERYHGLILNIFTLGLEMDLNKIEAFGSLIYDFDLTITEEEALEYLISMLKINYLLAQFANKNK